MSFLSPNEQSGTYEKAQSRVEETCVNVVNIKFLSTTTAKDYSMIMNEKIDSVSDIWNRKPTFSIAHVNISHSMVDICLL